MFRRKRPAAKTGYLLGMAAGFGVAAGSVLMYVADPTMGRRRRALATDKTRHWGRVTARAASLTARDIANRLGGTAAVIRRSLRHERIDDEVLAARVSSSLGRMSSHPGSIQVSVKDGRAVLTGPVLAGEANGVIKAVRAVDGVCGVDNRLELHDQADIRELHGGVRRERRPAFMAHHWSPAARFMFGATGSAMVTYGVARRDVLGTALGIGGASLLAGSIANVDIRRLIGRAGTRGISLQEEIVIAANPDYVYQVWNNYEHFPQFMSNVQKVEDTGEGKSHWVVSGPAGPPVEWDAVLTREVPGKLLAWRTEPGSLVDHEGEVQFSPRGDGSITAVSVRLSYSPPGGVVGHVLATMFGKSPRVQIEQDLRRMKSFVETGVASHERTSREEYNLRVT